MMKKLLPIFLVAFSYLFLFLIFFFCYLILGLISDDNYLLLLVILFLGLITLIFIPNMIYAWLLPKLGYNEEKILFLNMVLKLCFIPFNLIIFLLPIYALFLPIGFLVLIMVLGTPLGIFLIIFVYLCLITTSMYGIRGLWQAYKKKKITKGFMIVNMVMHLFFILDVISSVIIYTTVKMRSEEK